LSPDGRTLYAYQKDMSCDMIDVMLIGNKRKDDDTTASVA